eukprot:TRINITY_DN5655_c0_g2_i1.p1 TRINITY_DN5655_c0_g2~~TRINITY_DN5655_c0_g2_i1.p1  ORF type:complete len:671 (+),score=167.59 TRINITY_DN5655_c0_g2_i1:94-2106(+)
MDASSLRGTQPKVHLPRPTKVKNRAVAEVQITAEQIIADAQRFQDEEFKPPTQKINDLEELQEYRMQKRKQYEDNIRRQRTFIGNYVKYAQWEESQREYDRARSIYERAIDVEPRNIKLWVKYAEFEMKYKNVNRARNIWDRAVTLLPRVDQFWYKYTHMEQMLGNIPGARQVFERWIKWEPEEQAWMSYAKMELRFGEIERARSVYERYVIAKPSIESYLKYAKFEEKQNDVPRARAVYERAVDELGELSKNEDFYIAFATFEERCNDFDRARTIYKYALDNVPKNEAKELYKSFISFEKQRGDRAGIEDVIVSKRRFQYEEQLKDDSTNYDIWFDYINLEEAEQNADRIREVYERAIANVPPATEKRLWRRYIYLWIMYAMYEELDAKDIERARQVYAAAIKLIPHKKFTFAKIWIMASNLEIRQKNLQAARKILGHAIGVAPKQKVFKHYIDMEIQLSNIENCRILYQKYLGFMPFNCQAWVRFADLEKSLQENERCRAIYELAIDQPALDMPEILWKSYIDFEISLGEHDRTRELYERLLERTKHVKVWLSYAQFEVTVRDFEKARGVFNRAQQSMKDLQQKEERAMVMESWRDFERISGNAEDLQAVQSRMPNKVKKKRPIATEDGSDGGWEEYYDYIFPDDSTGAPNLKLLEMAQMWKKQKTTH